MKHFKKVKQFKFVFFICTLLLTSCSTWRYDHPRVRIEGGKADKVDEVDEAKLKVNEPVTTEFSAVNTNGSEPAQPSVQETASNVQEEQPAKVSGKTSKHQGRFEEVAKSPKSTQSPFSFLEKINKGDRLFKVKDVEQAQLSGWLKIMIILFAVGLVLIILGVILSVALFGGFWWIFYFLGSLCILAGCVVLILGLTGVMS